MAGLQFSNVLHRIPPSVAAVFSVWFRTLLVEFAYSLRVYRRHKAWVRKRGVTCGEMRKRFEMGGERVFDRTEHSHLIRTPGAIPVCHISSHPHTSSHQAGMWSGQVPQKYSPRHHLVQLWWIIGEGTVNDPGPSVGAFHGFPRPTYGPSIAFSFRCVDKSDTDRHTHIHPGTSTVGQ